MISNVEKKIDFTTLPKIESEPRYSVKVISNEEVVPSVAVINLERPRNFVFQPGQYLWLVLPMRSKKDGIVDRRAYSIACSKDDKVLELLVRLTGSDYLNAVQKLKKGDGVEIIGPMGSTFTPPEDGAILVAGGTGISPFLSILRSTQNNKFSLYGFESPERPLYGKNELIKIASTLGCVAKFFRGPATVEHFHEISTQADNRPIFISGPQPFINDVFSHLTQLGIMRERMCFEACYPEDNKIKEIQEIFKISDFNKPTEKKYPTTSLGHIFSQIAYQTSNHVIFTDRNGLILYGNDAAVDITGYSLPEMLGQTPRLWGGLMPPEQYHKILWHNLKEGTSLKRTLLNRHKDGHLYVALSSISPIFENKTIIGYVATEENITNLRDLDKTKTEFISLASHQLRTPLTAINWYTEMILNGDRGKITPDQKQYLEEIHAGDKRMIELVNTLLNVSRLELGTFTIKPEPIQLKDVAESELEKLKPKIVAKKITLKKNYDPLLPIISADPKMIRIIFQNLLGNAIKYVGVNGKIRLDISIQESTALIKIWNNGVGIPKEAQPKIFTKLFRDDLAKQREPDGNGLGLYIVKSIVENSGGKIWFESSALGSVEGVENPGVTFYVTLPLDRTKGKT